MIAGETLRALRETRGWDQQTLALRTGIDASVVSRLERGLQTDLKASVLIKLAQALDISLDALVGHQPGSTPAIVSELEILLPEIQRLPTIYQQHLAAIIRAYLVALPELPASSSV